MGQIITDSESLKKYRGQLTQVAEQLMQQLKKTESAIETVSEQWQDAQFKNFEKNFTEDKEKIEPLSKTLQRYESDVIYPLEIKVRKYEDSKTYLS